ncbi:MAG: VOC family protein [Phenylobacterium sp.]|uniref:VOC family protein n=1 Tax=Phenylobacterium sp. TaxID=1871053 RepID=UPI0027351DB4|nr:VOC family protein [Phenylobacterium sp.]MDP3745987.1 VOC family protein [Phenylobacterium sp.]
MLSHVSFGVKDLARAGVFYDAVLRPLGWVRIWDDPRGLGYGRPGEGEKLNLFPHADARPPGPGFHIAFDAPDQASVDAFHAAALSAGGTDRGAPGLRRTYSPTYYAAFVTDPDGHRLEAVHQ